MQARDIIVIGASAGGIQALTEIVRELPADFPGTIFVVVHIPPQESVLPLVLSRAGSIPATHARHRERVVPGHIFVAPPDYHLLVRPGWIDLSHGPREHYTRPAVDPLFRSASRAFGPRVVGVILSGALADGTTGLLAIKSRDGVAIVQDPREAIIPGMPQTALQLVEIDHVLPARMIAGKLLELVGQAAPSERASEVADIFEHTERAIAEDFAEQEGNLRNGELTLFTCPDCGGPLWQTGEANILRFQCHVGHAYQGETLLGQKSEEAEAALWASMRLLKERAALTRQVANRVRATGDRMRAEKFEEHAAQDDVHVRSRRELLESNTDPLAASISPVSSSGDR